MAKDYEVMVNELSEKISEVLAPESGKEITIAVALAAMSRVAAVIISEGAPKNQHHMLMKAVSQEIQQNIEILSD